MNIRATPPARTVGVADAKRKLSQLLKDAEAGRETIITRNGQPVAKLVPPLRPPKVAKARERAIQRMIKMMENTNLHLGGRRFTRDEMHER